MRYVAAIFVMLHFGVAAQQVDPILFNEKSFDFGEIAEDAGKADHDFMFTNNTGRVIRILSVQTSCGCTTPGWTKDPVAPGGTAYVKASFDPTGKPGYFNKSLTVTTDFEGGPVTLQIKGQVIPKKQVVSHTDFPVESGSLRFKFGTFPLDKIYINRPPMVKEFQLYNPSDKPINFTGKVVGPAYIKVETPKVVPAGEKATLKVSYDAKARNQYGFVSDNVEIETDDDKLRVKSFSVYATIEEYFPAIAPEELAKAPVLRIDLSSVEFGRVAQGTTIVKEVPVKNMGKKDLVIRAIQGNCTCITGVANLMKLKAGEEGKIKITLVTTGRSGIQTKAVTIYSTDPKNPVQRVTVSGYVE